MANPELKFVISGDNKDFLKALQGTEEAAKDTAKSVSSSFETSAGLLAGYFSADALGEAFNFAGEFDDQLRRVQAATGATAAEFDILKQKAIELGGEPGQTPAQIAKGMAELALAGRDVNGIMTSVAATAQLAAGSELEFGEAAEKSTDILAQYGRTAGDTQDLVDVLIRGSNSASTTVGQLAEAYSYAGGVSDSFGQTTNKTGAALLVLANAGLKAERGGTALRGLWGVLSSKAGELGDKYGIAIEEMKDGQPVVRDLADIVDDLTAANISAIDRIKIFGKEAGPGVAALLKGGGDAIRKYEEELNNAAGTGAEVSKVLQGNLGGGLRTITSQLQEALLKGIDPLVPGLLLIADNAYIAGRGVDFLIGVVKGAASAMTGLAAGGFQVLSMFESITDLAGITDDSFNSMSISATAAKESALALAEESGKSFDAFGGVISELSISEEQLASGTQKLKQEFAEISATTGLMVDSIEDFDEAVKNGLIVQNESSGKWVSAEEEKQVAIKETASVIQEQEEAVRKAAEEQVKAADTLYNDLGIASEEYYRNEAQKILDQAAVWEAAGADQVQIEQGLYDKIKELSADAWEQGNQDAGIFLDGLTGGYTNAVTSITAEQAALLEEFEKLTGIELSVDDMTDWAAISADIEAIEADVRSLDEEDVSIEIDADTDRFMDGLDEVEERLEQLDELQNRQVGNGGGRVAMTPEQILADNSILGDKSIYEMAIAAKKAGKKKFKDRLGNEHNVSDFYSFAGGGYTGDGSRSGGVDGKGGFFSIVHKQEVVTDLTSKASVKQAQKAFGVGDSIDYNQLASAIVSAMRGLGDEIGQTIAQSLPTSQSIPVSQGVAFLSSAQNRLGRRS
jgi:TP901 family phage tail tape measure protein